MNYSHTDIQLNTLKSFRSLLRKLDTLQSNEFCNWSEYIKNPHTFVKNGSNSLQMKNFYDYYMGDDGLELEVKYQILQDTIEDLTNLQLQLKAPHRLFKSNDLNSENFDTIKTYLSSLPKHDPKYIHYHTSLQNIGEYLVDEQGYLEFALKQVVTASKKVCATLSTISNDTSHNQVADEKWVNNIAVAPSNMSERVMERRDHTSATPQGNAHEY